MNGKTDEVSRNSVTVNNRDRELPQQLDSCHGFSKFVYCTGVLNCGGAFSPVWNNLHSLC